MNKILYMSTALIGASIAVIGFTYFDTVQGLFSAKKSNVLPAPGTTLENNNTPEVSIPNNITVAENDAGKELIDPPLFRQPLSYPVSARTVKFTILGDSGIRTNVTLDPKTFDYKALTNYNDDFYYVHANGSVCFGKPAFKKTYCLREKYTPAAMARYIIGDTGFDTRELNTDEDAILNLMLELGWAPTNALASFMGGIELAIQLLYNQNLKDGSVLNIQNDKKVIEVGRVNNVQFLETLENIKTVGINLATVLALINNREESEDMGFSLFHLEDAKNDDALTSLEEDYGIDLDKYLIVQ